MPPIRFINLERDSTRLKRMQTEFNRLGLQAERFPAVLWNTMDSSAQASLYDPAINARQHHLPLVSGEKGCYASHLALWQWLLDSKYECAIVLEDDVRLTAGFAPVCEAIGKLREPWHMIKLIGREGIGKAEKLQASRALVAGHALVQYRRVPSLTAGYAIHRLGAEALLAHRKPFGRPIDVDLRHWWECGSQFQLLGVQPAPIELDESSEQSSINASLKALPLGIRWRKFLFKLRYSLANARYTR
jgi:glycosyl transferase family 25